MRAVGGSIFSCASHPSFLFPPPLSLQLCSYNQPKRRATVDAFSSPPTLAHAHEHCQGAVMAILTNPIWVVKVRTITAPPNSPAAYCGLRSDFRAIFRDEG
ncbi:hypothetical protein EDB84DRAFT_544751 [Lactarius hengduanensis]|nr:hypothetical protein EDB84DRAFT_544751 [Lactarius hengduanensis]